MRVRVLLASALTGCGPALVVPGDDGGGTSAGTSDEATTEPGTDGGATNADVTAGTVETNPPLTSGNSGATTTPTTSEPTGAASDESGMELPSDVPPWELPPECAHLGEESAYCLTDDDGRWLLFGLDTGATCHFGRAPLFSPAGNIGMAWPDMSVIRCIGEASFGYLTRIRIDTGEVEETDVECTQAVDYGNDLLVLRFLEASKRFDNFEAALADQEPEILDFDVRDSRVGSDGPELVSAWHSTDVITRHDIETGADLGAILLEGHDDWVHGVDRINGEVVIGTRFGVKKFNANTGALLATFPDVDVDVSAAIACRSTIDPE